MNAWGKQKKNKKKSRRRTYEEVIKVNFQLMMSFMIVFYALASTMFHNMESENLLTEKNECFRRNESSLRRAFTSVILI